MTKLRVCLIVLLVVGIIATFSILPGCKEATETTAAATTAAATTVAETTAAATTAEAAETTAADVIKGGKLGYVAMDMKLSYFQSQWQAVQTIGEREGFTPILMDPAFDTQKYIDQVDNLIAQKVFGILLSVWEPGLGAGAVQKIQEAKIPVVVMHVSAADTVKVPTVEADNYKAGLLAGAEAARLWKEKNADRKAVVAIITNTDAPTNVQRTQGMLDAFQKEIPDAKLVKTLDGGYDLEKSLAAGQDILTANPDVNVIFTAHDTQAMGALGALKGAGRGTWPDAIICSVDASRQSSDEIKKPDSAFRVSIGNSPVTMTETAWGILKKVIAGEEVPALTLHDMELVTIDNIDAYLDKNFPIAK
jgi:ABC-type sugar transport system substrate-binding protein